VTLLLELEPYFNFLARWILMEEDQYKFHRVKDELQYAAARSDGPLDPAVADDYQRRLSDIWTHLSESWLEERRRASDG
jgi:hypothetical protein